MVQPLGETSLDAASYKIQCTLIIGLNNSSNMYPLEKGENMGQHKGLYVKVYGSFFHSV